jgi:glycosyltransferase involved in cell wall biosynthesis
MPRRVALVVQRYGIEVNGGAELLCRMIAERLARRHHIEVLTTCAVDYLTWRNEYAPGPSELNGVPVRRFPVSIPRDVKEFSRYSAWLFGNPHTAADERHWVDLQGPDPGALAAYLDAHGSGYDAFIFFTYLYATTRLVLPLVADRALLVPTAHDEPPIYLGIYDELFHLPRRLLMSTPEERDFVERRFCLDGSASEMVGVGVDPWKDPPADAVWSGIRERTAGAPLITYIGRIDESKGCAEMMAYFRRYRDDRPASRVVLVLIGKPAMPVPQHPAILRAGFVSEETKRNALRDSRVILAPSPYESLSLVALEAWMAGKPLLANGRCAVLRGQCSRSNGGLWYTDYEEFRACLDLLLEDDGLSSALAGQGRAYTTANYSWPRVEERYDELIEAVACGAAEAHG